MRPLLALCLAAACSGGPGATDDSFERGTRVHPMPLRSSLMHRPPPTTPMFSYYGGPVLSKVKITEVPWGGNVRFASYLGTFYTAITNSEYFDLLAEYKTPSQTIGRGSFEAFVVDTSPPAGTVVDDAQIQTELDRMLRAGALAPNDESSLYVVHFPPGITVTQDGAASCVDFCAYHGTFKRNGAIVPYVVIPDLGGDCQNACGAGDDMAATTWVASHEIVEAVTDPAVGFAGTSLAAPLGWYDQSAGELSDACAGTAQISTYVVQTQWSAKDGKCRFGSNATGSFALGVSPLEQTVRAGTSATLLITTAATGASPATITLSASGLPGGVTASFAPPTVPAGRTSVLTLAAGAGAGGLTTDITITGSTDSEKEWATARLTVIGEQPANDFSIAATPVSQTVQVGSSTQFMVTTKLTSGSAESVVFSVTGLPDGVTPVFTPPSASAGGTTLLTLTASAAATIGSGLITITGTAHSNRHAATASLDVEGLPPADDFMLSVAPPMQTVQAGDQTSFTVSTAVTSGNAQSVALSVTGLPSGVTGSFNPPTVTAGSGSTLTLSAAAGATPVSGIAFTITGTATSGMHITTAAVTVTPPPPVDDFTIGVTPTSRSVQAGQTTTLTVTTQVASGNPVAINFAISGLPAGVTASFAPTSVTAGASTTLTITTSLDATQGAIPLTITGASTTTNHGVGATVTVTAPPPSDFTLGVTPPSQSVSGGDSVSYVVATHVKSGSAVAIDLSVTGLPAGVSASFMPMTVMAGGSSSLKLTAMPGATAAVASFTVHGSGNGFNHTATAQVTVTMPPADDFSIAMSPPSQTVMAGDQTTYMITTAVTSGNAQSLALSVTGLPAGVTGQFTSSTINAGDMTTLTLTTDPGAASATATFTVSAVATSGTHAAMADVTVQAQPMVTLLTNGDFEDGTLDGWTIGGGKAINSTATAHGGSHSARIGSTGTYHIDSELYQSIAVPATGTTTLNFWAYGRCPSGATWQNTGVQEADILDSGGFTLTTIFRDCSDEGIWKPKTVDLTPYAGTTVFFDVYIQPDAFYGDSVWVYIDDATVTNQ
jgi:uncharacterized membrane protein